MAGFTSGLVDHGTEDGGDRRGIATVTGTDTIEVIVMDITAARAPVTVRAIGQGNAIRTTTCIETAMEPTETGLTEPAPRMRRIASSHENRVSQTMFTRIRTATFSVIRGGTGRATITRRVAGRTRRDRQTRAAMRRRATVAIRGVHRIDRPHRIALRGAAAEVNGDKRFGGS